MTFNIQHGLSTHQPQPNKPLHPNPLYKPILRAERPSHVVVVSGPETGAPRGITARAVGDMAAFAAGGRLSGKPLYNNRWAARGLTAISASLNSTITMDELQPGDKVVELGAMVRSVTIATGAISSALLLLLAKQSVAICFAGFFVGAIAGLISGLILSRLLYTDGKGNVNVVKATPANLPVTLRAAFKGAVFQTLLVIVVLSIMGKIVAWPLAASLAVGANVLIASLIARLSLS